MSEELKYIVATHRDFARYLGEYDPQRRWHVHLTSPEDLLGLRPAVLLVVGFVNKEMSRTINAAQERGWAVEFLDD